jgi:hypothetical protein
MTLLLIGLLCGAILFQRGAVTGFILRLAGSMRSSTSTWARSLARLTVAFFTPGTLRNARSTRPAQLAQVMPVMGKSNVSGLGIADAP